MHNIDCDPLKKSYSKKQLVANFVVPWEPEWHRRGTSISKIGNQNLPKTNRRLKYLRNDRHFVFTFCIYILYLHFATTKLYLAQIEDFLLSQPTLMDDDTHSDQEPRYIAFGYYEERFLFVVFTLRVKDKTITLRMSADLLSRYKKLAKEENTKYQKLIREALLEFLLKRVS